MLTEWMAVEPRDERLVRQDKERISQREADREAERINRLEEAREQRQHEWLIAKTYAEAQANANGNGTDVSADLVEALSTISDALNGLASRVEAIEARLDKAEAVAESTTRRLDYVQPNAREVAEKTTADIKDTVSGIKSDVAFLRFRLDALVSKRNQPTESHVIIHQG
jgi:hypothetical protein